MTRTFLAISAALLYAQLHAADPVTPATPAPVPAGPKPTLANVS